MNVTLIAACSERNGVIGADGVIPWYLPSDLKRFKEYTKNKIVVMGRTTFESLPVFLYDRVSIVMTNQFQKVQDKVNELKTTSGKEASPILLMSSIGDLIEALPAVVEQFPVNKQEVVVIGGESIYEQFLPMANKILLSLVRGEFFGDRFFPKLDRSVWKKTSINKGIREVDDEYEYSILTMVSPKSNIYSFPEGNRLSKLDTFKYLK